MHYSTLKYYIAWQLQNMFNFPSPIFILLFLNLVSFKSSDLLAVKTFIRILYSWYSPHAMRAVDTYSFLIDYK